MILAITVGFFLLRPLPVQAARLGLAPLIADGLAGRTTVISGTQFLPSTILTVTFRGTGVLPATVVADANGAIAPVTLTLPALPAGPQDVVLTGGGRTYTFVGAYQVFRNICLGPAQGDGCAGMTYYDPAAGALSALTGAWMGMVTVIEGWGFSVSGTVAANTITLGGSATRHPQINISATGRLQSTTIIVQSNLTGGFKDIVINDGAATTFAGVYTIRRRIGAYPDRGTNVPGPTATIFISGYGFDDTVIAANTITINAASTAHPTVTPVNGAFTLTVTLTGTPSAGAGPVAIQGEVFTNGYDAVPPAGKQLGLSLSTLFSVNNHAIEVEGMGNLVAGTMAANSMVIQETGADVTTTHPAVTIANGRFPRVWIKINSSMESGAPAVSVFDAAPGGAARIDARGVMVRQALRLCPLFGTGEPAFSVSITAFGFGNGKQVAANSILFGGRNTVHPAISESVHGEVPTMSVTMSATMFGSEEIVIADGGGNTATWPKAFHVLRTIGLSFVNGNGAAGEMTALSGNGFSGGLVAANSMVMGSATTHPASTVTSSGVVAASVITLPSMAPGAYDLDLPAGQGSQSFSQVYRVGRLISAAKHVTPAAAVSETIATFSISYTNTGIGDWANGVSILDTIPAGMVYAPGSAASSRPATINWFSSVCACFTAVEPASANVVSVRWTLTGLLPQGAGGNVSFKVTVQ